MSNRYKFVDSYSTYFVTFAVIDWIDVFTRNEYRKIVVDSMNHCVLQKGLVIHGWVLMTNHVHLLLSLKPDDTNSLSDILRDMKKYTAMQLIKRINENEHESRREWMMYLFRNAGKHNSNNTQFQFWRQDNHPLLIKDGDQLSKTLEYIHNNPVSSGLSDDPVAYPWSSAKDYAGKKGMVDVTLL